MVGLWIEGGLPHVIPVLPAIPILLHLVIKLALAAVITIPLLLKKENIQDLHHLVVEDTVEKDRIHSTAERGHTHTPHPIMGMLEAVVRVQQKAQAGAEVQLLTVMSALSSLRSQ